MKRLAFTLVFLLLALPAFADEVINEVRNPDILFAFSAKSGTMQRDTLSLESPSQVIYFADRPARIAGHISLNTFASLWESDATDSFKSDPPNAVVSILGTQTPDVVVELLHAAIEEGSIRLTVRPIKGELPAQLPECSVFVDAATPGTLGVFGHLGGM